MAANCDRSETKDFPELFANESSGSLWPGSPVTAIPTQSPRTGVSRGRGWSRRVLRQKNEAKKQNAGLRGCGRPSQPSEEARTAHWPRLAGK